VKHERTTEAKQTGSTKQASAPPDKAGEARILPDDLMYTFFSSIPPRQAGAFLNEISLEHLVTIFSQTVSDDPDSPLRQWTRLHFQRLESFNIEKDVGRLANLGVEPEVIALVMMAIRLSRGFDGAFGQFGDKRTRKRHAKSLLSPIPVLEDLATIIGEIPDELAHEKFPNPKKTISDLKTLSYVVNVGEWLCSFLGANSLLELSKFALASLVHETTKKFHDREVSNIIGAALWNYDFDETAHRVWRNSNYSRLFKDAHIATRILLALNKVVLRSKQTS